MVGKKGFLIYFILLFLDNRFFLGATESDQPKGFVARKFLKFSNFILTTFNKFFLPEEAQFICLSLHNYVNRGVRECQNQEAS